MERFSEKIKHALLRFFMLDAFEFSEILMTNDVLENISAFARQNHPKEFVAIIGGKVKNKQLLIDDLFYQEYVSSNHSASFSSFLPKAVNGIGTVHSHPSSNARPSNADIFFFSKKGGVHFIIGYPYNKDTLHAYDIKGNELTFSILYDE